MKMNRYAFTALPSNSFTARTMVAREVGDEYVDSIRGRGIVVHVEKGVMAHKIIVRTDITLDQLIEAL